MKRIRIDVGEISLEAELNESATAEAIWDSLPLEGSANRWGDEIYFQIPVEAAPEPEARAEVEVGELAYWPVGRAFCIFFGPTPVSVDDQPRAYSPVNILGRVLGDSTSLRSAPDGARVRVVAAGESPA